MYKVGIMSNFLIFNFEIEDKERLRRFNCIFLIDKVNIEFFVKV